MYSRLESILTACARIVFSGAVVFFGLEHFVYGGFVTRLVPGLPGAVWAGTMAAYGTGLLLVVLGFGLMWARTARFAACVLGGVLLVSFIGIHMPAVTHDVLWGGSWTSAGKALVMLAGGFAAADASRPIPATRPRLVRAVAFLAVSAPFVFAGFLLLAGVQHFVWEEFVSTLVPTWIPLGQVFWSRAAGVLLLAGGSGIVWSGTRVPAARGVALMILLWVPFVHVPRALAAPIGDANEWTAVFEALAFSALALLVGRGRR